MSRGLTTAMKDALTARQVEPAILVELEFDSGTDRIWTGYGDLSWDGKTWNGAGELLGIRPFSETTDVTATQAQVTISGIPASWISLALSEDYQGRTGTLYLAAIDSSGNVISDPAEFAGRMDQMQIEKSGETMLIRLSIESQLIDLRKPREFRYTDQDQQIDYPNDKGFEYVAGLQDKTLTWGPDNRGTFQKNRDRVRRDASVSTQTRTRRHPRHGNLLIEQEFAVTDQGETLGPTGPGTTKKAPRKPFRGGGGGGR